MNIMGMGIPELGVIMLVAFLVLGPGRAIDMARSAGKIMGDLRRSFGEVTSAMTMESMEQGSSGQSQQPANQAEPPPGVPMRAEIPPEDEEEPAAASELESGEKG